MVSRQWIPEDATAPPPSGNVRDRPDAIIVRPPATGNRRPPPPLDCRPIYSRYAAAVAATDLRRYVYEAQRSIPPTCEAPSTDIPAWGPISTKGAGSASGPRGYAWGASASSSPTPSTVVGIGKALMRDSFDYARARGHTLLMLHGAPAYYQPFGYADVFDATEHECGARTFLPILPAPTACGRRQPRTPRPCSICTSATSVHIPAASPAQSIRNFLIVSPPLSIPCLRATRRTAVAPTVVAVDER